MEEAPKCFKGCKCTRDIMKRGLAKDGDYIFSRLDKKTDQWVQSESNSRKVDEVFLSEAFIKTIQEIDPVANLSDHVAEDAPLVLQLDDHKCCLE